MKSILKPLIFGLIVSTAISSFAEKKTNNEAIKPINSIAAIVNKDVITESDLDTQVRLIRTQLRMQQQKIPAESVLKKQMLNQLIAIKLQLQQAEKEGVSIDEDQIDRAIEGIAKQNQLTLTALKQQVIKQGLTYEQYRHQIQDQLAITAAQRQAIKEHITVSEQEVAEAMHTAAKKTEAIPMYHLMAILVPVPAVPTPNEIREAQNKAESIIKSLNQGQKFTDVAIAMSAGNDALQGGDMGWKPLTELAPQLTAKVAEASQGQVIGPIQMPTGFLILKVAGIKSISAEHSVLLTHIRHILLKQDPLAISDDARGKIQTIRQQIEKGASFEKMASEYSQDNNSAKKGGDLGWISKDEVPVNFADAMQKLKPGQISQPIQTQDGWELIQVLGRKKVDNTQHNLTNQVRNMIFQRKYQQAVENWVRELRSGAFIKIM